MHELDREKLKALMDAQELTAPELALKAGISRPAMYHLLNGIRRNPSASTIAGIAQALGVQCEDLLRTM